MIFFAFSEFKRDEFSSIFFIDSRGARAANHQLLWVPVDEQPHRGRKRGPGLSSGKGGIADCHESAFGDAAACPDLSGRRAGPVGRFGVETETAGTRLDSKWSVKKMLIGTSRCSIDWLLDFLFDCLLDWLLAWSLDLLIELSWSKFLIPYVNAFLFLLTCSLILILLILLVQYFL